jgi:alpha,alpha-trehalase
LRSTVCRSFLLLVLSLLTGSHSPAQPSHSEAADKANILRFIDGAWDTLSRSMMDCNSLVDPKVTTTPVLFLPAGMATPAAVSDMQKHCKIEVHNLPRKITHLGDVRVTDLPAEGLLYLPNRYVVPGGRFNEQYGWDSYFIILGLISNKRVDLARGMIENFFFQIENYGSILNANRTYYLTRSQPPFLTSMIREVYEHPGGAPISKAWLAKAYGYAKRDYNFWISPPNLAGDTGLARYHDVGEGPVPEMADDSTYYPDVIRWLLAHPAVQTDFLLEAPANPTPEQIAELAKTSCDITASIVCAHAYADGHRLTAGFYRGDRAMRASGFDPSFRFGPFSGSTDRYAPVCLNSLLYKYERDMAHFATLLGLTAEATEWNRRAVARRTAINKYLWDPKREMFYDYDFTTHQISSYNYITSFYPLWAGLATQQQAHALERHLPTLEREGGIAQSDFDSGTQWDLPFGWAPTTWIAIKGLYQYGDSADAKRIATNFSNTILQNFVHDGTIREKYNVVSSSANVEVATGYKANVIGFGWTNGVYLQMSELLTRTPRRATKRRREQEVAPVSYQLRINFAR